MNKYLILIALSLSLVSSPVVYGAEKGFFSITKGPSLLLLEVEEMNVGRTNVWTAVEPTFSLVTDPVTGEEYAIQTNQETLAFAVVRDRAVRRDRRIDINSNGTMITIRNYCIDNDERLTGRNQTEVEFYVYVVGQEHASMLTCKGGVKSVPVREIHRIVSLARGVPPSLLLEMTSVRIALDGAAMRASRAMQKRN